MDDQQRSERFCWKLDVEYHKYIYCTYNHGHVKYNIFSVAIVTAITSKLQEQ